MLLRCLLALALLAAPIAVHSHGWYPMECCGNQDCAAVDKVEMVQPASGSSAPIMLVTTKWGTGAVPPSLARRESKDHQMHACMIPDSAGGMRVLCLFMPPSM